MLSCMNPVPEQRGPTQSINSTEQSIEISPVVGWTVIARPTTAGLGMGGSSVGLTNVPWN